MNRSRYDLTSLPTLATVACVALCGSAQIAYGQTAPAPAPVAAPAPAPVVAPAPVPAPAEPPAAAPAPEPMPAPIPADVPESHLEAMGRAEPLPADAVAAPVEAPAEEDPAKKPISVGAWGRVGLRLQSPTEPKKLNHLTLNETTLELHFDGQATKEIGLTGNVVGAISSTDQNGTAELLDVIARFDIDDAFHVWGGRMLVPSDRANFSGAWFAAPWYYPGIFSSNGFMGPRAQGPNGRNDGLTVWGQAAGGLFKYYAGAYDLWDPTAKPWWSGRINVSLINPEPGYYHSSTYYGGKDVLAIGIGGALKKDGSVFAPMTGPALIDDASMFNADVLFEKNLDDAGVIDLEGAFYLYQGDYEPFKHSFLLVGSWLTPEKVGPGKIQPLIRFQQGKVRATGDTDTSVEIQLGYPIAEYGARVSLGYQMTDVSGTKGNALFLGAQILK